MNDSIVEQATKRVLCRYLHLTYDNLMYTLIEPDLIIDTKKCEFGNDEEHCSFFKNL